MLPAVVCVVIMMVNGNVGAGVAVAGAFSLVRFRSVPGTAKEITMLFLAMGAGLIAGMGYLAYSVLFTLILGMVALLWARIDPVAKKNSALYKTLNITIPEDLDYSQVFDSIFKEYTTSYELIRVKTTNMGSLFRLTFDLTMKAGAKEKDITLIIAEKTKALLEEAGYKVIMTRSEDVLNYDDENASMTKKRRQDLLKLKKFSKMSHYLYLILHLNLHLN